ncbi:MAG: DUF5686 and carboxypeptidase regulatory-like domain-containing protein, partial [Duncaniella sp.]|nr:DUF5686 and carboxypeptidase regulatory-like domain-containing protein [Duncaniella sp.]
MRLRIFVALVFLLVAASPVAWSQHRVEGVVVDSLTTAAIPYALVSPSGAKEGVVADERGHFGLNLPDGCSSLDINAMGYSRRTISLPEDRNLINVSLVPVGIDLAGVEKSASRKKYSKKGNPAVEFVRRLREKAHEADPRRHPDFSYENYERISLALNDFDVSKPDSFSSRGRRFGFVEEYVDTSEITGRPILNVAVREKLSDVVYHDGHRIEIVDGLRASGVDEMIDPASLRRFYEEVLGETDVYDGDINLLQHRFVSPLSRIAPDFYKFYLTDTVEITGDSCVEITFVPHNPALPGFRGQLYVELGDTSMFVKHIEMEVPGETGLNYVRNLHITQVYAKAADGSRLKERDDLVMEAVLLPGQPGVYARRLSVHADHSFEPPEVKIAGVEEGEIVLPVATRRDAEYWRRRRTASISDGELRMEELMGKFREERLFRIIEGGIKILTDGYVPVGKKGKLAYGPVVSSIGYNTLEGWRLRGGLTTTAELSARWFASGYMAYGFRDRRVKYGAEVEYSFRDKQSFAREFPMHSLRVSSIYDMNRLGQDNSGAEKDAWWFSLRFAPDVQMTYIRRQRLEYTLETQRHFSIEATVDHQKQFATRYMTFVNGLGEVRPTLSLASAELKVRFSPGEKVFQTRMRRSSIDPSAPVFQLHLKYAPDNILGNRFSYLSAIVSASKRFWLPAFGYFNVRLSGGHVFTSAPYPLLLIPDANLSYFFGNSSFQC